MDLKIKAKQITNDVSVLAPEGSIDSFSYEDFIEASNKQLQQVPKALLLDLANVKYISSVGLGAIITLMKKTKDKNCAFAIYDPQIPVKRVLEISRLDFLELLPEKLETGSLFYPYIVSEEPKRQIRRSEELEKLNKHNQEIASRLNKEKNSKK